MSVTVPRVCLLTGLPGTGKTSLIKQAVSGLKSRAGGFYTEEIRREGLRLGFKLVTLDGREAVLAHVDFSKRCRVGKYGVDLGSLEQVGVAAVQSAVAECDLIVIDEIGRMELFSEAFREAVLRAFDSDKAVLGMVMLRPHPWVDRLKRLPWVKLVEVSRANRDRVSAGLRDWLAAAGLLLRDWN